MLLHAPALAAIRDATGDRHRPARDYLWYDEITLPTDPADRARFRTALRQAEKRARDATAKAGDPWGGVAMSLGVRDGTKPWRTTVLCLLASHPVRIPAGVPTRGWERLPRADALRVLAEEVLLVGAISAQTQLRGAWRPTPDRWRRDDPIVGSLGPAPTGLYGPEWHTDETFDAALKTRWPDALDEFSAAGRSAAGRRRETVEAAELAAELASQLRRRGQQRRSTRR
ncbi:MAG: hypothetical protein ACXV3F_12105 [Frankiaceae bacterium]